MKEPNIRLRALELEDLDFLYQIENDDRLWELGVSNVPYSRRVLLDYITSASADIYHRFGAFQVNFLVEGFYTKLSDVFALTDKAFSRNTYRNVICPRRTPGRSDQKRS